jgi:hypothetical protein
MNRAVKRFDIREVMPLQIAEPLNSSEIITEDSQI